MSTFSDVQALYGTVRETWAKSQAHVIAHVVLAAGVFWLCGASVPELPIPQVNPKQISESEWFKLGKDTGIIYVSFLIPIVAVATYLAVLRTGGQFLVTILMLAFPPPPHKNAHRLLSSWVLEPLALTLGKKDFSFADLRLKAAELTFKYNSKKDAQWEVFQKSSAELTKNSQIYLGDFLVFLVVWVLFFRIAPDENWVRANRDSFWEVVALLGGLALFARFRVSRAMAVLPTWHMMCVSSMLRADPDMARALENREEIRRVGERIEELLRKEREDSDSRPSLFAFFKDKLGFKQMPAKDQDGPQDRGRPFAALYERGRHFSWDEQWHANFNEQWIAGYRAYLYFRMHRRVTQMMEAIWQFARYIVTGAP